MTEAGSALERALGLFEPARRPEEAETGRGYLDLLGDRDAAGAHPGQRLMSSRLLPLIYQRFWRPLWGRVLMGVGGPGTREEHRIARAMLAISPGDRVLDVGCGPGNFTREFAVAAGDGLVVGLDASETMLDAAVRQTPDANVAYVRADAAELPFRDAGFDAVCCFAALYLIEEPTRALDELVRVLAPAGRAGILASCNRGPLPTGGANAIVRGLSGVRVFGRDELTRALADRGLTEVDQRVSGLGQFVWGRKPG